MRRELGTLDRLIEARPSLVDWNVLAMVERPSHLGLQACWRSSQGSQA
jgi:hypothetical protein